MTSRACCSYSNLFLRRPIRSFPAPACCSCPCLHNLWILLRPSRYNAVSMLVSPLLVLQDLDGIPAVAIYIISGIFGAIIGSFLNVVIHRVPREESIVFPNSRCPSCGATIAFYDNIPIISYALLGGKCRNCRTPISARYPAVELLTALSWVAVAA